MLLVSGKKSRKGMEISMANVISDETIEYVGILAKLELSEEKEAAKKDMGRMLDYIDKLSELDTHWCGTYVPCIPSSECLP